MYRLIEMFKNEIEHLDRVRRMESKNVYDVIKEFIMSKIKQLNEKKHFYPQVYVVKANGGFYVVELEFSGSWKWHIYKANGVYDLDRHTNL